MGPTQRIDLVTNLCMAGVWEEIRTKLGFLINSLDHSTVLEVGGR